MSLWGVKTIKRFEEIIVSSPKAEKSITARLTLWTQN